MEKRLYRLFLLILFGGVSSIPLIQSIETGGYVFYCNGLDESAYLQYDYSRIIWELSGLARFGQFIVNSLHEIGFSGGWINLLFDLSSLSVLLFLLASLLSLLGFSKEFKYSALIILFGLPVLFCGINPFIRYLSNLNQTSDLIYWFAMPDASGHPFFRTPEPQISYLILVLGIYASLRYRNILFAYLVVPLLYPFVAIPFLFTLLSFHLRQRLINIVNINFVIPLISFVSIGLIIFIHSNWFVSDYVKSYMVNTNLPLISGMGLVCFVFHIICSALLEERERFISWILVLSNFVAVNTQIFSGWLIQSSNYEQYWGVIVVAVMTIMYLPQLKIVFKNIVTVLSLILLSYNIYHYYDYNMQIYKRIPWSDELLASIKKDPSRVLVDDVAVSSWLTMLFPKQSPLLFTLIRSYKSMGDVNFIPYLCAKRYIQESTAQSGDFEAVLTELDAAYSSGHKYSPLYTNLRKPFLKPERDLNITVQDCNTRDLKVFPIRR